MSLVTVDTDVLRALVRDAVVEALDGQADRRRRTAPQRSLISAAEADRRYRRAKGTAATAYRAGLVRGDERRGASRTGRVIWINAADAERLWSGSTHTDLALEAR